MKRFRFLKWLIPGMRIKRWLLLAWLGVTLFSLGLLYITNPHNAIEMELTVLDWLRSVSGFPVPSWVVDVAFMALGMILMVAGIRQWFHSIYRALVPLEKKKLVEVVYDERFHEGVKLVALGGGTGLSSLLRGLKEFTPNITAVVTVSDDGGSSGRLRKELGLLPPGDIRNCLVALADDESLLSALFNYRFAEGPDAPGLGGHSFGNLFLAALSGLAGGDFDQAVKLSSSILAIRGRVLPATLESASLCADFHDGSRIEGESEITHHMQRIRRVHLKPVDCAPQPEVLDAVREADVIILGPGSLYTSVLPNLLVKGVADAVAASKAVKIYVCNVMTQPGETDGLAASDHVKALLEHVGRRILDYCLLNNEVPRPELLNKYEAKGQTPVKADVEEIERMGISAVPCGLISETDLVRHDPQRLAEAIQKLVNRSVPHKGLFSAGGFNHHDTQRIKV
ncbi:MAG: gluconeogenesis factor YvcK family protein [Candidatus Xenobia bacterium]